MGKRGAMCRLFGERHPAAALAVLALLAPLLLGVAGVGPLGAAQAGAEGSNVICTNHGAGEAASSQPEGATPPAGHVCCGPICPHAMASALAPDGAGAGWAVAGDPSGPRPDAPAAPRRGMPAHDPIRGPPQDIA